MARSAVSSVVSSKAGLNLAGVFHHCFGCAWVAIDERRRIADISPEAEHITQLSARQVKNQPFEILPSPLQKIIRETFSTGKSVRARRIKVPTAGEGEIPIRLSTVAVRTATGRRFAVIAVMSDLSPAEKLGQTIQRLERLASIGMLSTSMAHEIKNALVAVRTFIDLLLEKNQDAELAEIVSREMRRVNSLVSQMLKFAGPAKPACSSTRVHELLDQSLRMVQHQLEGKLIAVRRAYVAASDVIKGNDHQLQQAFVNLFLNAADAMGPNGELSVATEQVSAGATHAGRGSAKNRPHVRITIKDTGVGIAPENTGRLFEPFFTTKKNGTGLGLAITQQIIQEHGGTIAVESLVNQGTAFHIHLPLLD
jgi:signal transduction histidine kinase